MDRLINLRANLALSQRQMAVLMGVPLNTYRSWEKGYRHPSAGVRQFITFMELVNMINPAILESFKGAIK